MAYAVDRNQSHLGGYCGGVPPLPIPNREVKPASADGTAAMWESRSPPTYPRPGSRKGAGPFLLHIPQPKFDASRLKSLMLRV